MNLAFGDNFFGFDVKEKGSKRKNWATSNWKAPHIKEDIFANHVSDKVFKVYKELMQLNHKEKPTKCKNERRIGTDLFPKSDIPIANRFMRGCSTSLTNHLGNSI